jgi:hypothetical protein
VKHKKPLSKLIETIERKSISKRKPKGLLIQISLENPTIIQEALSKVEASHWKKTIIEEIKSLQKNNIWSLTTLFPNQNVVGYKWIFKVKLNANGTIAKYKAKVVAKGIFNNNFFLLSKDIFSSCETYFNLNVVILCSTS